MPAHALTNYLHPLLEKFLFRSFAHFELEFYLFWILISYRIYNLQIFVAAMRAVVLQSLFLCLNMSVCARVFRSLQGHQIWSWSFRWLWAPDVGTRNSTSSGLKESQVLSTLAISPAPLYFLSPIAPCFQSWCWGSNEGTVQTRRALSYILQLPFPHF